MYLRFQSRSASLSYLYKIKNYGPHPLSAIMPVHSLESLWLNIEGLKNALGFLSIFVLLIALISLLVTLNTNLIERVAEMMIYRSLDMNRSFIVRLLLLESILLSIIAILVSYGSLFLIQMSTANYLQSKFGILVEVTFLQKSDILICIIFLALAGLIALILATRLYAAKFRTSFAD